MLQNLVTWFRNLDIRKVATVIVILGTLEHGIVVGEVPLDGAVPASWIPHIIAWCKIFVYVNPFLVAGQGFTAIKWSTPSLATVTKAAAVILAVGLAVSFALPAMAQTKTAPAKAVAKVTIAQAQTNPLAVLQQFSIADLQAALADAQANNDVTTIPCWTALLAGVQAQQAAAPALPAGVFSAIQKTRDLKIQAANLLAANGPLANLNIACAPLLMDANATLAAFGIATGVVVGTGGIALPALPGFLPLLLAPK